MTLQKKWVLLTAVGWILGFLAALAFTPLANALTGKYLQQSPLPITMVIVIGILQSVILRKYSSKSIKWLWIYLFSFTPCFIGIEMIADLMQVKPEMYIPVSTLLSGLLAGYLQAKYYLLLSGKPIFIWTIRCGLSWFGTVMLIFGVVYLGEFLPKPVGIILNMLMIAGGGFVPGYFTRNISDYINVK